MDTILIFACKGICFFCVSGIIVYERIALDWGKDFALQAESSLYEKEIVIKLCKGQQKLAKTYRALNSKVFQNIFPWPCGTQKMEARQGGLDCN